MILISPQLFLGMWLAVNREKLLPQFQLPTRHALAELVPFHRAMLETHTAHDGWFS